MTVPDPVTQDDLHAYVDGALAPGEQARVEAWLAEHPDDAAAVHAWRLQNSRLHENFDSILDEPAPSEQEAIVTGRPGASAGIRGQAGKHAGWRRIAASVVLLLAGGVGGWLLHGWQAYPDTAASDAFVEQAVGAHRVFVTEVRHPVEVPSSQEAHLVAWLSKRLGTKLVAPDIRDAGFELVGGRLLAEGARPAAQFMYEDSGGRRLTIYVRAADSTADTAFRFASGDGVSAFYWAESAFAYALIGPLQRPELLDIAHKVYQELDR